MIIYWNIQKFCAISNLEDIKKWLNKALSNLIYHWSWHCFVKWFWAKLFYDYVNHFCRIDILFTPPPTYTQLHVSSLLFPWAILCFPCRRKRPQRGLDMEEIMTQAHLSSPPNIFFSCIFSYHTISVFGSKQRSVLNIFSYRYCHFYLNNA